MCIVADYILVIVYTASMCRPSRVGRRVYGHRVYGQLSVSILTQIKVKYLVFPALSTKNVLKKLGSIYSSTSFTVRHQGILLNVPGAPSRTALQLTL